MTKETESPIFYQEEIEINEEYIRYGYNGPGWYFYEETWAYVHGPYKSREEASEACNEYAKSL